MTPLSPAGLVRGDRALALQHRDPRCRRAGAQARARPRARGCRRRRRRRRTPWGMAGVRHRAIVITIMNPMNGTCQCRRPTAPARMMALPLKPPVKPQLALSRKQLPEGEGWAYEPKYDGFRAMAFVDGDDVFLQSRNGQAAGALLPRAPVPGGPLRARRRAGDPRRATGARSSTRSRTASTRRSRGSTCWPRRRRRSSAPSTCSRRDGASCSSEPFEERRAALEALGRGPRRSRIDRADAAGHRRATRPSPG